MAIVRKDFSEQVNFCLCLGNFFYRGRHFFFLMPSIKFRSLHMQNRTVYCLATFLVVLRFFFVLFFLIFFCGVGGGKRITYCWLCGLRSFLVTWCFIMCTGIEFQLATCKTVALLAILFLWPWVLGFLPIA